jgi:hypothetical protein
MERVERYGVYVNTLTMADDHAQRFEVHEYAVYDAIVLVATQSMLFGNQSSQTFPRDAAEGFSLDKVDLQDLWFRNKTAASNGTVHILATVKY